MLATGPEEASSDDGIRGEISNLVSMESDEAPSNGFVARKIEKN